MKRLLLVVVLIACLSAMGYARDRDVRAVVTALEQHYGMRHEGIPWAVRAMMKPFLWGSDTTLSVELFEGQSLPATVSMRELEELSTGALGTGWKPFVRVHSRRDNEKTLIYARPEGKKMVLLIVTAEANETTVVKVRLDGSETKDWIVDPETSSRKGQNHKPTAQSNAG